MGIEAFAERARRELLATGDTVRKRTAETVSELTAQEAQIARLAAQLDGLAPIAKELADARARRLPLSFRVLGATTEPVPQWPDAALSIHGQYADEGLATLIAAERPDVIWFPAQVPETYSYTLSVALAAGTAIVVSALGALAERASGHPRAMLVRWDAAPAEWNEALLKAGALGSTTRAALSRVAIQ